MSHFINVLNYHGGGGRWFPFLLVLKIIYDVPSHSMEQRCNKIIVLTEKGKILFYFLFCFVIFVFIFVILMSHISCMSLSASALAINCFLFFMAYRCSHLASL